MPPIFVDTAYVVASVNPRDKYHVQARNLAHIFDSGPLIITDAVLMEIGNGLSRHFKPQAVSIIDHLRTHADVEIVNVTPALFDEGFSLYRRFQDKQWGLVDCISFVVMRARGMTDALTFDQHFSQAGFNALMREPA